MTLISMFLFFKYLFANFSLYFLYNLLSLNISIFPKDIVIFDKFFIFVLAFPIADSIRPQFGSCANNAVFTKSEFAIYIAISLPCFFVLTFLTLIEINFVAPSPS